MFDSLATWLSWLEKLHPKSIELSLDRIQRVAQRLSLHTAPAFVITVGGTNGKGSCVALLESILLHADFKVGAYFSPHLIHFNERIRINGDEVSDKALCQAFSVVNASRADVSLTYFEFTTLAALWLFQQAQLEFLILEVGLGGRLDAVNILSPDIAIIPTVSLDHTDWLGDTRELIAKEKAGIFRKDQTVIYGEADVPNSILQTCEQLHCALNKMDREFSFFKTGDTWDFIGKKKLTQLPLPIIALQNAATTLQAITSLPACFFVSEEAIRSGLQNINLKGRFQCFQQKATVIFDVAHNPASAQRLAENLKEFKKFKKLYAVVGMLNDKDHKNTLLPLLDLIDSWYITSLPGDRGLSATQLSQVLSAFTSRPITLFPSPEIAYHQLQEILQPDEGVVVFGSFLTVGALLRSIHAH